MPQSKADHCARAFPREDYSEPKGEQLTAEQRQHAMDAFLKNGGRVTKCPPRKAAAKKID
jgi:hypothetical protein